MKSILLLSPRLLAVVALFPARMAAQSAPTSRSAEVDLTVGRHTISGGEVDFRAGALFDVLVSDAVRNSASWSLVGAVGGGGVLGGFGDRCLIRPEGGCAPRANFVTVNVLIGPERSLDGTGVRLLVGPALYDGSKSRSIGAQARADVVFDPPAHIGLGLMVRGTLLPSFGGQRLFASAIGGSVILH